jgi:hypothetical protein
MPDQDSSQTMSDEEIIAGIRRQDDKTFNWLYNNYLQVVRHHVIKNSDQRMMHLMYFRINYRAYRRIMDGNLSLSADLKGFFFGIAKNIWKGCCGTSTE